MDIKEFRRLGAKRARAVQEAADLTEQLRPHVAEFLRTGEVKPTEMAKLTGYSVAQVRNIARAGGVEPAKRGRSARSTESTPAQ